MTQRLTAPVLVAGTIVLLLVLWGPVEATSAAPCRQGGCPPGCGPCGGIPCCARCSFNPGTGSFRCAAGCSSQQPPNPTAVPPSTAPPQPPPTNPPAATELPLPGSTPGPGGTPAPGGPPGPGGPPAPGSTPGPVGPPSPTETPLPPTQETRCYECYPHAVCESGYADTCFLLDWNYDPPRIYPIEWTCRSAESCQAEPPEEPPGDDPPTPCIPDPPDVLCEGLYWGFDLWVSARVPPHRVQIDPFPRWLVAMGAPLPAPYESGEPGQLILQDYPAFTPPELCAPSGPGYSAGCWSNPAHWPARPEGDEPQEGDVRDLRLGLRWRRVRSDRPDAGDLGPVPPVCWLFDERPWNIGADYGYGPIVDSACGATQVSHIYETSSWDKPENGPRFVPREEACPAWQQSSGCCEQVPEQWDMPSYQVRVYTTWAAEWAIKWEQYEQVGVGDYGGDESCFCRAEGEPTGVPHVGCSASVAACSACSSWCGKVAEPEVDWVEHEPEWETIDLRDFGNGTWYYTSWQVCSGGSGPWCAFEYGTCGGAVPVPVVEVQSVLRDPCVLDESCSPTWRGNQR